jgi:hypothetical protein
MFFEQYFKNRGESIEPNHNNEVQVRCPFPHDKGFEENASASFNIKHRIYKCFACTAEDRDNGMSETSFISKVFNTTYDNASKLKNIIIDSDGFDQLNVNLLKNENLKKYLNETRGLTDSTIVQYQLGYMGTGIVYPVFMFGMLFDTRTYDKDHAPDEPKIKSRPKAKPLLFPFDHWVKDTRPTILTAGENDTLLGRQNGFNCVETTLGEGSVPKIVISFFKGRKVYITYDCDKAGKQSALRMAYYLKEAGADVYLVDLGLTGTKDDKDLTDYFLKHNKKPEDFQSLIDNAPAFTTEQYIEQKNKEYELIDLWNVKQSRYSDKYISSRVMQMGHFELPLVDVPSHIEWACRGEMEGNVCAMCPRHIKNQSGEWSLESENLEDLLELVDVNKDLQFKGMRRVCGIPAKCPNSRMNVMAKKHVEKVILAPDVETESEQSGFKSAELHAYVLDGETVDGERYRMYFKRVPNPKDQTIVLIVDKFESSDNAINMFKVTPDFINSMKIWQGDPYTIMTRRFELLGKKAVGKYLPEYVFYAADLTYHGILDINFMGKLMKGHPEGLMIGASRTGKSEVLKALNLFYGLGNYTEVKNASTAGLIGGVDKSSSGTFRISWGEIPRNHKGLMFLDEISGLPPEVYKHLTGVRSEREAVIAKIVKGKAPAKTRLLWVGNPKTKEDGRSKTLYDYSSGVDVCLDLFPADEDVSRFDFIVLVPEPAEYISPLNDDGTVPPPPELPTELKDLIRWAWSRTSGQVKFAEYVEKYIEHVALELNKDFGSSVKIVGIEATKKIARIATAVAAACFSTDESGETVIVRKEHVDWTRDFLINCYDNDIFQLKQYVQNERKFSTTTDEINLEVVKLIKQYPMIIKVLLEQESVPTYVLQNVGNINSKDEYNHVIHSMYSLGLLTAVKGGSYAGTRRLKLAIAAIKNQTKEKKQVDKGKPRSFSDKINLQ